MAAMTTVLSMAPQPARGVEVSTEISAAAWSDTLVDIEILTGRAAQAAFHAGAPAVYQGRTIEAGVRLADDAELRELNREYRGQDKPTNVLSFNGLDDGELERLPPDAPLMLGDIVIAYETAAAEAACEAKSLGDHLSHLVVHGMLHLLGYDHIEEGDATLMERLEAEVLAGMGIANPYDAGSDSAAEQTGARIR